MKRKNKLISLGMILFCVVFCCMTLDLTAYAAAGTVYETEYNGNSDSANRTYDDYNSYGDISFDNDVDWWKVSFDYSGTAIFSLENIPSGCDYDLNLYVGSGAYFARSSANRGNASEYITYNVSANTTYYLEVTTYTEGSDEPYLLRAKVYPNHTISDVPLYEQHDETTCGCACGRMMLASFGINITEEAFKEYAADIAGEHDYTYVYVIKNALNHFLSANNKSTRYKYTSVSSYDEAEYRDLLLANILNNHPVQANMKVSSTTHFPYTTSGHYVVIKGLSFSTTTSSYNTIVNDPHDDYSATYTVPLSAMLSYTHAHSSGGYLIHVDD